MYDKISQDERGQYHGQDEVKDNIGKIQDDMKWKTRVKQVIDEFR